MSGICIPGMEMPTSCFGCRFCRNYDEPKQGHYCMILVGDLSKILITKIRAGNCPLVSVPDHHDLIDKNDLKLALMDIKYEDNARKDLAAVFREINLAKTIIPADKEGE